MKYLKYLLLLSSILLLKYSFAQDATEEQINSGYVFIDGVFIKPPYSVERVGTAIFINKYQITKEQEILTKDDFFLPKYDIGLPPNLQKMDSIDDIFERIKEGSKESYILAKLNFLYSHYDFKTARAKALDYLKSLPNIKNATGVDIVDIEAYNGEKRKVIIGGSSLRQFNQLFGPNGIGLPSEDEYIKVIDKRVQGVGNSLRLGKACFIFRDSTRFDEFVSFYLPSENCSEVLIELTRVCNSSELWYQQKVDTIKNSILKSNQVYPYLNQIINNFDIDTTLIDRHIKGHKSPTKSDTGYTKSVDVQKNIRSSTTAYSPNNININIGSADPWSNRYIFLFPSFADLCVNFLST